jgi:hypothetical protein
MILGTFQCTAVFFTVWTKSIFTFGTPATQTPVVVAKSSQSLYKIWWQLPVFRRWYRDMMLVSFDTLWCSGQSMHSPSHSEHLQHGHPCSLQNYLKDDGDFSYSDVGIVIWFGVPFGTLWCCLQSEQSPCSHCTTLSFLKYEGNFQYSDVGIVIWCCVSFDRLWCSVQSIQSPSSHSDDLQHKHPCSLFIAKFSNFWNMMATSGFKMLVPWYDSGIFWYTVEFCTVYTESFFRF